jgi:serine/threonine protein kinase
MDYVDGCSVGDWLREQPRPWRDVVRVFQQAGVGLAAAHEAGLVHRDFKPDNVLLRKDGRACVSDFGLASAQFQDLGAVSAGSGSLSSHLTQAGCVLGTPAYMAPEQF